MEEDGDLKSNGILKWKKSGWNWKKIEAGKEEEKGREDVWYWEREIWENICGD